MPTPRAHDRVATLWELAWNDERLSCVVCRGTDGLRLRIESPTTVIVSEHFTMQPRAVARVRALRDALRRRGWDNAPPSPTSKADSHSSDELPAR